MHYKGKDYKTVFLLGAGATRGAVKHVLVNRKRLKPPLNSDFFDVADTFARTCKANSIESRRLSRLNRFFNEELPTKGKIPMETAFSLLYVVKDFPEIYRNRPGPKTIPGERQEIEDFLLLVSQVLCAIDDHAPEDNGYAQLVSKLGAQDTILSLNYDTLLDSALVRAGWNPKKGYGLTGGENKVEWQPLKSSQHNSLLDSVRLLKLHGSLNWFVRGSFSNISEIFEKKPVRVTPPRKNAISKHIRQIIPPIYGKFFQHNHWRTLWKSACDALQKAEILVVIGCSMVDTDFHLRALISQTKKDRKKNNQLFRHAVFVDNNLQVRRKWIKAIKGGTSNILSINGFDNFLKRKDFKL